MKIYNFRRNRRGSAFVVVMVLTAVLMIAGVSITYLTSNAAFTSRKINTGARALAVAEAGIADHITKMATNGGSGYTYWASGVINNGSLDGGTYVVQASKPPTSPNYVLTSVGTINGESRTTIIELLREGTLSGAVIAKGNITLDSSAMTINGDVYAGGNVYNSQGNPNINGNVSAAGGTIQVNGTGTEDPNAPPIDNEDVLACVAGEIPYPVVPPFTAYSNAAASGGLIYSGNKTWSGEAINPTNGIVFVSGNATVSGRSSLRGIIVATGNITIDNQFTGITVFNTNWTVSLIAGYNVDCDNRNNFAGMIFAGNDITMSNNRDIRGKLVALNNIFIKNRGVVTPPPAASTGYPEVKIGGWLR